MAEQQGLKFLIAAGGTAGHVLPSLAVAEALVERGAKVTFAGSPDRVEARLVPDAGFELDTFRISGLPRRPTPALGSALGRALRAPRACKRILRPREPARRAVRRARIPLVPDRGARRAEVPRHRPADPGSEPGDVEGRGAPRFRPAAARARVARVRRQPGGGEPERGAGRGVRRG